MTAGMSAREYSTRSRAHPAADTVADALDGAIRLEADGRGNVRAPLRLQSWPGIVHGGAVLALFDAAATALGAPAGPRTIEGRLTSPVPIDAPLELEGRLEDGLVRLAISQDRHPLASAAVTGADAPSAPDQWTADGEHWALPTSETCLACGSLNPIGLRAELRFDARGVWVDLDPRPAWRGAGARLHMAAAPVILDEVAWWLGAMVSREGGVTNRLRVTLHRTDAAWDKPVRARGRFERVTPIDRNRTFWRVEPELLAADGALLATAAIVFRGGADYSERQLPYFRDRTLPETFRRMFPAYAS